MREHWSWERAGERVVERLDALLDSPAPHPARSAAIALPALPVVAAPGSRNGNGRAAARIWARTCSAW